MKFARVAFTITVGKGTASTDHLPTPSPTHLIVTRLNYVVRTIIAEPQEYQLLELLISGKNLGDSLEQAEEQSTMTDTEQMNHIAVWFRKWATDRFFIVVQKR